MLKIVRVILAVLGTLLGGFILITQNFDFMSYLMLILGISLLITGGLEIQKNKKGFLGYANILIALFAFYVSIGEIFMLSNILFPILILALLVGVGFILVKFFRDKQVTIWLLVIVVAFLIWFFTR